MNGTRLKAFARMALATTIATYTLILVGALVRAAGAGLGCPDWPKCFGSWIPPLQASQLPPGWDPAQFNATLTWLGEGMTPAPAPLVVAALIFLGVLTIGLLIVATLVMALLWHRHRPRLLWPSVAATILVGFQGWLGGQVVRSGLEPWMITTHMVVALVIVTLLLYATFHARLQRAGLPRSDDPARRRFRVAVVTVIVLSLVQVGLGTNVRGAMEHAVDENPELPRSEWVEQVGTLDKVHRGYSQLLLVATIGLAVWSRRRFRNDTGLVRAADASVALVVAQMILGAALVYMDVPPVAQLLHLSAASVYLGMLTLLALQSQREPVATADELAPPVAPPAADPGHA
jgi:cytochrome c oxidase assembly protein subunit 15